MSKGKAFALSNSASKRVGATGGGDSGEVVVARSSRLRASTGVSLSTNSKTYVRLFQRIFRLVAALRATARTDRNDDPFVCASWNCPGVFPSVVTPAPSMAAIGPGKLMVVTRFVATGTVTTIRSSSVIR